MTAIYLDRKIDDDTRRRQIHDGSLYVYSPNDHSLALCELARELLTEAFGGRDPRYAQFDLEVEEYAAILGQVKPRFIHHPECKRILPRLLAHLGCDSEQTYFDIPRMRSATSSGYLTSGIAYAFHPHRDTWYSAPMCQINWWIPMYEFEEGSGMAFHQQYFNRAIANDSETYDYQAWNATARFTAAQQIGRDARKQPHAQEPVALDPRCVVVTPPGGLLLFSAAQLHSTMPNDTGQTRFSIDFRVVHRGDLEALRGARNVDSRCTGSAIDDYLRATDLAHLPQELQNRYLPGHPQGVQGVHAAEESAS